MELNTNSSSFTQTVSAKVYLLSNTTNYILYFLCRRAAGAGHLRPSHRLRDQAGGRVRGEQSYQEPGDAESPPHPRGHLQVRYNIQESVSHLQILSPPSHLASYWSAEAGGAASPPITADLRQI